MMFVARLHYASASQLI
jgi:hypothetical protein